MIRTFIFGIILGIAGVLTTLYFVPVVDQHRETSVISVTPNGGNTELFYVKVPVDRIMIGAQDLQQALPPGMEWPDDPRFANVRTELFKLRNSRDAVVGIAGRTAAKDPVAGDVIEWVLHLPARGTAFVNIPPGATGDGRRVGDIRAGSREFRTLIGQLSERWVPATDENAKGQGGRIELLMSSVGTAVEETPAESEE